MASATGTDGAADQMFWDLVEPYLAEGRLEEGQIMRSRCVRANGEFVAMADHRDGDLVVKLPAERVEGLIADGSGEPFAPAGKVFREWVQVTDRDQRSWQRLLDEAISFASDDQQGSTT